VVTDPRVADPRTALRRTLMDRVKLTIATALLFGILGMTLSPAGGPSAGLLDLALLCLALWLSRGPSPAPAAGSNSGGMTGNQALLLVLALGGAAVLVVAGAASRPLHGLAVAPFAMAAFALSSHNSRDLRSGVLAALASLLVLSAADDRGLEVVICVAGLLPLVFGWIAVRQLMALDRNPDLMPLLLEPSHRPWSVPVVGQLVLATAVVALLLPVEPAPHLHGGSGSSGSGQTPAADAGARGNAIGAASGDLDLRARGTLDARPMLSVPLDSPTLWQGSYFDRYTGSGWLRTGAATAGAPAQLSLPLATALPTGTNLSSGTVKPLSQTDLFQVYSPGPVVAVNAPAGRVFLWQYGLISLQNRADFSMPYTVVWRDPKDGTVAPTLARGVVSITDPQWRQLPSELPGRVGDLARSVTASATTVEGKVSAIESYLRSHEKYELDSPVPAVGTDAVDAFLFIDHVGFCEQFASAETVMLRTLGIPARVATGFGGNGVAASDGTSRTYRNEDAHAWVQVGLAGERWVDSDPTAGSQLAATGLRNGLVAWVKKVWQELTGTATARRILAAVLLAVALGGWFLVRRLLGLLRARRLRRRRQPVRPPELESPAGQAYQRLLARLAGQDRTRKPTETVRDLLLRLGARQRDSVALVLEAEWYGRSGALSPDLVALAVAVLDELAVEQPVGTSP
jgi:protein-glutamine gamma-glutamyltransferase